MRCVHLCVIPICLLSFGPESGEPSRPPPLVKKVRGHAASKYGCSAHRLLLPSYSNIKIDLLWKPQMGFF